MKRSHDAERPPSPLPAGFDALAYLIARSTINSARFRLLRLREPRYLIPFVAVLIYFWLALGMPGLRPSEVPRLPLDSVMHATAGILQLALIVGLASSWLTAPRNPAPAFSEAEVYGLFPAPLSRRALVGYALLRMQPPLALLAVGFAALGLASEGSRALHYGLGIYLLFNLFALNSVVAALTSARLSAGTGGRFLARIPGLAICLYVGIALALSYSTPSVPHQSVVDVLHWATQWLEKAPADRMLWPWRTAALLPFTGTSAEFGHRLLVTLAMSALYLIATLAIDAPFEEDALTRAHSARRRAVAFRRGRGALADLARVVGPLRQPLPLRPRGPAWSALAWKNLMAFVRMLSARQATVLAAFLALPTAGAFALRSSTDVGVFSLIAIDLVFLLMLGPTWFGQGIRSDLQHADVLKSAPVTGRDILRGGVYSATAVLSLVAAGILIVTALIAPGSHWTPLPAASSGVIGLAMILCFAGTCGLTLSVDGALAVLAPAWTLPESGQTGIESMGRELLNLAARTVLVCLLVSPIAALAVGAAALAWPGLGQLSVLLGGAIALAAAGATSELVCAWTGRRLDRLDPSCEGL